MPTRSSTAQWEGDLKAGKGTMTVGKGAYTGPFSFASRFEEGTGTNPEELLAAAHAGCFSMAFSNELAKAGHTPTRVQTKATAYLEGGTITKFALETEATVPGLDSAKFQEIAEGAKQNCPVSKLFKGSAEITLSAKLL
ncbi:MAG TPA: OsmC family protein [Polyangia bacterium]|jgi:osmotically inducible protein OsmC